MKYIPLFVFIQIVSLVLTPMGWVLCPFGWVPWLWWNDDDAAIIKAMSAWDRYVYLAWRNPVANLRHVPGVSKVGRPLYYRTWLVKGRQMYLKMGWMSDGYPALSTGSGRGY